MIGQEKSPCTPQEETIKMIISQLYNIPEYIALVAVNGKQPYKQKWLDKMFSRKEIEMDLQTDKATGFAMKLSGQDYLAIDVDGGSAHEYLNIKLLEIGLMLPKTVQWTSNKEPFRYSFLLRVSNEQATKLNNIVKTTKKINTGRNEQLELRWSKACCVLPPSIHPDTQKPYVWINSFENCKIAKCTNELLEALLADIHEPNSHPQERRDYDLNTLEEIMSYIPLEQYDYYDAWITVMMALHHATGGSIEGLELVNKWSQGEFSPDYQSPKYQGHKDIKSKWTSLNPNKNGYTIRTLCWYANKHSYKNETYIYKSIQELEDEIKQANQSNNISIDLVVERMNREYALIQSLGNKAIILKMNNTQFPSFEFLPQSSLSIWCKNRTAITAYKDLSDNESKPIKETWDNIWLKHPTRKEYATVRFAPGIELPSDIFNLFQGFAVEPVEGDISMYRQHVLEVICNSKQELFETVWKWLAHLFQKPWELPRIALVLTNTKQGIGKGAFLEPIKSLLGGHYREETNMDRVAGKFNAHLANCLLLNANEATWGGDKQKEGTLKALITDSTRTIEYKGKDSISLDNYTRLIVTSNELWSVPVGKDDRRFIAWTPTNKYKGNSQYFDKLWKLINSQEFLSALLYEFLYKVDLAGYIPSNIDNIPFSEEYLDLKLTSFQNSNTDSYFWESIVLDGINHLDSYFGSLWKENISLDELHESFRTWCIQQNRQRIESKDQFMRKIKQYLPPEIQESRIIENGNRIRTLINWNLEEIRKYFAEKVLHTPYHKLKELYSWE